ncbi:hypothetical protein Hte_007711 [Hypoxylon texense]
MHYFYWRDQYAECDALLMGVAFLGLNDFLVIYNHGNNLPWGWSRIFFSVLFASTGYFGLTEGLGRAQKAKDPGGPLEIHPGSTSPSFRERRIRPSHNHQSVAPGREEWMDTNEIGSCIKSGGGTY